MIKSEEEILQTVLKNLSQGPDVVIGPGDDCAVIETEGGKLQLLTVDQLIADVHYKKGNTPPEKIARKLINRNLSDIAAMGGVPAHALLTIAMDLKAQPECQTWFNDFFNSLNEEALKWNFSICGGDISTSANTVLTLTLTGWVEKDKLCIRSNAKPGEILFCTGCFGNSFFSEHHLHFTPRIKEARFLSEGNYTRTIIDVSDGLLKDLRRIAMASKVGVILDTSRIPLRQDAAIEQALSDGEDYELLFSVPGESIDDLTGQWPFKETPLTRIGTFTAENVGVVSNSQGNDLIERRNPGFDHFIQQVKDD